MRGCPGEAGPGRAEEGSGSGPGQPEAAETARPSAMTGSCWMKRRRAKSQKRGGDAHRLPVPPTPRPGRGRARSRSLLRGQARFFTAISLLEYSLVLFPPASVLSFRLCFLSSPKTDF